MKLPLHQKLHRQMAYILGAILVFGGLLSAVRHATALITPTVTYAVSAALLVLWLGTELGFRRVSIPWVLKSGVKVEVRRLGQSFRCAAVGLLVLLWFPRVFYVQVESNSSEIREIRDAVKSIASELSKQRVVSQVPPEVMGLQRLSNRVVSLSVAHSGVIGISHEEVDRVLSIASVFLVPCNLRVQRTGRVATTSVIARHSPAATPAVASTPPADVTIVDEPLLNPYVSAISRRQTQNIILRREREAITGFMLAHSLGHLAGLLHTNQATSSYSLMDAGVETREELFRSFPEVTPSECAALETLVPRFRKLHGE